MPQSPLASFLRMGSPSQRPQGLRQSTESESTGDEPEKKDNPMEESMENCIEAPEGLKTPSGHAEGSSFQGTFRGYLKDGKLYFRSVNNIPLPGNEEDETDEDEKSETPEEEKNEQEMGMEEHPPDDEEDKAYKKKKKDEMAFNKAFRG